MLQVVYILETDFGIYIGETVNMDKRRYRHTLHQDLAYKLMNIDSRPEFKVLAYLNNTTKSQRLKIEYKWINHFKQFKNVINQDEQDRINKIVQKTTGQKRSLESRLKMSKVRQGKYLGDKNPAYKGEFIRLKHIETGRIIEGKGLIFMADRINSFATNLRRVLDGKNYSTKGWAKC